jgi:hypothetical protein
MTHAQQARPSSSTRVAILRVLGVALLLPTLGGVTLYTHARAKIDEHLLSAGAEMMKLSGEGTLSREQTLTLNGAAFHMRSGSTHQSVAAVVEHFAAACRGASGNLRQQIDPLAASHRPSTSHSGMLDGVLKEASAHQGYVACFDVGETHVAIDALAERMQRFAQTTDLSEIGDLRYVYVTGNARSTSYLSIWTDGKLPLASMFPEHSDAPGSDLPNVPRPSGARRALSAYGSETGSQVALYERAADSELLSKSAQTYAELLRTAGYSAKRIGVPRATEEVWVAEKGLRMLNVHFIATGDGTIRTVLGNFL